MFLASTFQTNEKQTGCVVGRQIALSGGASCAAVMGILQRPFNVFLICANLTNNKAVQDIPNSVSHTVSVSSHRCALIVALMKVWPVDKFPSWLDKLPGTIVLLLNIR